MTAASPPFRPTLRLVYPPGYPGVADTNHSHAGVPADDGLYDRPAVEIAPAPPEREVRVAARSIARENRRASSLTPDEARRILAVRIGELLQGGRAAILTPEHRARAVRLARLLGVRDFDTHLVIALVQDRARRGEIAVGAGLSNAAATPGAPGSSAQSPGFDAHPTPPGGPSERASRTPRTPDAGWTVVALQVAAAVLLAAAMLLGLISWGP